MIAAIELGKKYAQVCVKTVNMKDAESLSTVAGTENYRIPTEADLEDKVQLQEFFRKLWKLLSPYGNKDSLEYLVFCLEDNSEEMRGRLSEIVEIYNISLGKVRFMSKQECFCAYVFHQSAELLSHNALLIENCEGDKEKFILQKRARTTPMVAEVRNISEKSLESVFSDHAISSVFLVGDDFEEEWMQKNLKILRNGRRVFAGKNLYVKGAVYRGMELKEDVEEYLYIGAEKLCCHIALCSEINGKQEYIYIVEGGRNWYESNVALEVLLLDKPELEFALIPINGKEKKTTMIYLRDLPVRPKKTTRLRIELEFTNVSCAKIIIKDLGFGELFPPSDMVYEGELQWEQ